MASIQKRGKTYQYTVSRYIDGVYKPIRKGGFRSPKEAEAEARKVEAMLDSGVNFDIKNEIFHEYFKTWYTLTKRNLAKITLKDYANTHRLIKKHLKNITLGNITTLRYQKFINDIGESRSLETLSKVHTHIRNAVQTAINDGYISRDFTRNIELNYSVPAKSSEEKYLNYNDSMKLLQAITKKIDEHKATLTHYIILLGLTTGLRYGELVGLTRDDFDFEKGILNVDKTWGYHSASTEGFGKTKNKQSIRKIALDDYTLKAFKDYFERTEIHEENKHGLVFFNNPNTKYKVISNTYANRILAKMLKKLNIKPIITMHGLRHTHASLLLYKKDITTNYISERLGHGSVTTTLKRYAHVIRELREEDEKSSKEAISNLFKKSPQIFDKKK